MSSSRGIGNCCLFLLCQFSGLVTTFLWALLLCMKDSNVVWIYFLAVNSLTLALNVVDKVLAKSCGKRKTPDSRDEINFFTDYDYAAAEGSTYHIRVPEDLLWLSVSLGGAPAGAVCMWLLCHKQNKESFKLVFLMISFLSMFVLVGVELYLGFQGHDTMNCFCTSDSSSFFTDQISTAFNLTCY